jgi:TPR repeat protein
VTTMAAIRSLTAALVLFFLFVGAARAGDAEDGDTALHKGDYGTALKLLMPLAQQGNMLAQLDVGIMYFGGNGLPQNRVEGAKWFKEAAQQGSMGAQADLGIAYATGEGVPHDPVLAYVWFSLSASQNAGTDKAAAAYRDHVAGELTAAQLNQAQEIAKQCRTSNYRNCDGIQQ